MKRVLIVLGILLFAAAGLSAQPVDYADFAAAFQTFADETAATLPATAAMSGLSWSPAYIGQLPHFGAGVSVGFSTIPYDVVSPLIEDLEVSLPSEFKYVEKWGLPIPAAALDARLGGFLFPFDVGFKFGFVPDQLREKLGKVNLDYMLVGGDIRVPLLQERGAMPTLSISGGYTFMRGNVGMPDVFNSGDYQIDLQPYGGGILQASAPELNMIWDTHTFVGKIQASKNLFLFTPHIGLGAAYGVSNVGGGVSSSVEYDPDGGVPNFAPITQTDIDFIVNALTTAGQPVPDLSSDSILVTSSADGLSFWVYGGTAINILFIKVDLSAMYNFLSKSYGGAVNVRVQL
jgi:hypothetical protein